MPNHISIDHQQVDTGAQIDASLDTPLDPNESLRIRRKIDRVILPLIFILYFIQSLDTATLSSGSILRTGKAAHLTTNQSNWIRVILHLGSLAFELPQNLALQRFPVGKWMSLNIFIWGVVICSHAACMDFTGLMVVRFVFGICEGSVTAGFLVVSSMFYTRNEQTSRVGYCLLLSGIAQIISGFVSSDFLNMHTADPWQQLMIISGTLTLILALVFFFLFPDSPTNAWFLTEDERAKAVRRIKENQTGVENKNFKREQVIEALTDPKTWLFALFAAVNNLSTSLSTQLQIIIASIDFSPMQTTLLGWMSTLLILSNVIGIEVASRIPNSIAWVGIACFVPSLLGVFLINVLPWHDKAGLLFSIWIITPCATGYVLALSWVSQTTAGHTKSVTTNAIVLSAQSVGSATGQLMWKTKYRPRDHVPWTIIGLSFVSCMLLLFSIRVLLARENKRRDAEPRDDAFDDVTVEDTDEDGNQTEIKVSKEFLDLTDRQNRDFRYVL